MVPAPTTAALIHRNLRGVFRNAWNFRNFALAEENVDQRLGLIGKQAFLEQLGFALDAFVEGQFGGRLHRVDGGQWRHQIARFLRGGIARAAKIGALVCSLPSLPFRSRVRRGGVPILAPRESQRALQQIAFNNLVDDAAFERVRGADRIARRRTSPPLSPRPPAAAAVACPRRQE